MAQAVAPTRMWNILKQGCYLGGAVPEPPFCLPVGLPHPGPPARADGRAGPKVFLRILGILIGSPQALGGIRAFLSCNFTSNALKKSSFGKRCFLVIRGLSFSVFLFGGGGWEQLFLFFLSWKQA